MKIAIINVTAKFGSTGKIAYGQYMNLKMDGHDVRLYYGKRDEVESESIIRIISKAGEYSHALLARLTGLHGYFSTFSTRKLIKDLENWKPDLVQLYNLHGYYLNINKLLGYLGRKGIPTVYSMLDEYPYLGRCCYSLECEGYKTGCQNCQIKKTEYPRTLTFRFAKKFYEDKKRAYSAFDKICFAAPQYVVDKAKQSALLKKADLKVVDEYIDTDVVFTPKSDYRYIDKRFVNNDKIIVLTVAPYSYERKGGRFFLELAKKMEQDERFIFVYIGMDVNGVDLPCNVYAKGYVYNQEELAEYYSVADVFVCTSLADTMPNVCLDALACGTSVIGFDNTGIPYVAEEPLGKFVKTGDVNGLIEAVMAVKKKTKEDISKCREYAVRRYSPQTYYKKMVSIYKEMKKRNFIHEG